MTLNYLDFDYSEDADGNGTFDAMASVAPAQLAALQAEVVEVLQWAQAQFPHACGPLEEGGQWQYDLQGVQEVSTPLHLEVDLLAGRIDSRPAAAAPPRTTLTLSVSGTAAFCAALQGAFGIG